MTSQSTTTRTITSILTAGLLLAVAGCGGDETSAEAPVARPVVHTTFHPTACFVRRIAGELVEVVCPVPFGEDPITWSPSRENLAAYQAADLIVVNGAEFEKWVAQASLPESRIVDSVAGLPEGFVTFEATTHRHGAGGEHTHEGVDGHTWVDPLTAKYQAGQIAAALAGRWPEHARAFATGRAALDAELDSLDARLRELTPRLEGVTLLASHPAYQYLARRHDWSITSFDLDPEAVPDETQLEELAAKLDGEGPRLMLWEAAPLPETAVLLRERLGLESLPFSPAELLAPDALAAGEDYVTVMGANLDRLDAALPARDG